MGEVFWTPGGEGACGRVHSDRGLFRKAGDKVIIPAGCFGGACCAHGHQEGEEHGCLAGEPSRTEIYGLSAMPRKIWKDPPPTGD